MISGLVSFDEIVGAIKDETGIENMRPLYDRLRRFVFRAEREIGYGGSISLKKCVFTKGVNFNGTYIKFPDDLIEFEGVGSECGAFSIIDYSDQHPGGIRFRQSQNKVIMLYWALTCDGYGNPITTRNHEQAVIDYCVWKLYAAKRFLDKGNANTNFEYKQTWISSCLEARGDDAFPTLEQWNQLSSLNNSERSRLMIYPVASYNYQDDTITACCGQGEEPTPPIEIPNMYYWQLEGLTADVLDVQTDISVEYLNEKPQSPISAFLTGFTVPYTSVGRICFAIMETENESWAIYDALNNDVTGLFDMFYDNSIKAMVFVSKTYYTISNIYFKFVDIS